jgi:hypothetical protein
MGVAYEGWTSGGRAAQWQKKYTKWYKMFVRCFGTRWKRAASEFRGARGYHYGGEGREYDAAASEVHEVI